MGTSLHRVLRLGSRILRATAREGQAPQYRDPLAGIQMDPHSISLLENAYTIRRGRLSASAGYPAAPAARPGDCGSPVEKDRWLQQSCTGRGLTEDLRCLSSYQAPPL